MSILWKQYNQIPIVFSGIYNNYSRYEVRTGVLVPAKPSSPNYTSKGFRLISDHTIDKTIGDFPKTMSRIIIVPSNHHRKKEDYFM